MIFYLILLLLTALCCVYANGNKRKEIICAGLLLVTLGTLCGLRGLDCGTDNINYLSIFKYKDYDSLEYAFIGSLHIIPDFQLWLFIYAMATYMILFFQLKKETKYMCLGVLVFMISTSKFFPESFNVIRQSIAASIMLWAFVSWNQSKRIEAFSAILIAVLFHTSSIIALPFFLVKSIRIPFAICLISLVLTLILGMSHILNDTLQLFALGFSEYNSTDSIADVVNKYSSYGNGTSYLNANAMLINTFPITAMALLTYPFSAEAKEKYGFYYNIFWLATLIGNVFIPAMEYGFRIVFSLQIVQVLVLPLAFQYNKKVVRQLLICYLVFLSLVYLYYLHLLPVVGIRPIVPYKFFADLQFIVDAIF